MAEKSWAINKRKLIGAQDNPMLMRWTLLRTPWFGLFVHYIYREDLDRLPHDHPWTFFSWVIRGWYVEEYWPDSRHIGNGLHEMHWRQCRHRWSMRCFPLRAAHRITSVHGKVTTLVLVGPHRREFGFYLPLGTFIDWRDYHEPKGGWSDEQRRELGLPVRS